VLAAGAIFVNGVGYTAGLSAIVLVTVIGQALANGLTMPTQRLIANEFSPKHLRASVLSASTTITSLCMMAGFLASGLIADHGTARQLGLVACSLVIVGLLFTTKLPAKLLSQRHA
jgi:MFS family permease